MVSVLLLLLIAFQKSVCMAFCPQRACLRRGQGPASQSGFVDRRAVATNKPMLPRCDDLAAQQEDRQEDDNDPFSSSQTEPPNLYFVISSMVSTVSSVTVLWSEYAILTTGCGPQNLGDSVERLAYLVSIATFSVCWFCRLACSFQGLADVLHVPLLGRRALWVAETSSYVTVLGAIAVLWFQENVRGATITDGWSGIDLEYCRALQSILVESTILI